MCIISVYAWRLWCWMSIFGHRKHIEWHHGSKKYLHASYPNCYLWNDHNINTRRNFYSGTRTHVFIHTIRRHTWIEVRTLVGPVRRRICHRAWPRRDHLVAVVKYMDHRRPYLTQNPKIYRWTWRQRKSKVPTWKIQHFHTPSVYRRCTKVAFVYDLLRSTQKCWRTQQRYEILLLTSNFKPRPYRTQFMVFLFLNNRWKRIGNLSPWY